MTRSLRRALILLVALLVGLKVAAQEFPMLHFTREDGLPSDVVYGAYRDAKGFLWFATDNGIARYNGLKFEIFTIYDGLPDNEIFFFFEDNSGRLWIATYNGQFCYYKDDTFHTAQNTPWLKLDKIYPHIADFSIEYDSSVIIQAYDNTVFYVIKDDRLKLIDLKTYNDSFKVGTVIRKKMPGGKYFIGCNDKAYILDTLGHILQQYPKKIDGEKPIFSQGQRFLFNRKGVFDLDEKPLYKYDSSFFDNNHIQNLFHDSTGYFFCTNHGLFVNGMRILNANVSTVTKDNDGNYWIATVGNGVYCMKKDFLNTRIYHDKYKFDVKYLKPLGGKVYFTTNDNSLFAYDNGIVTNIFDYGKYIHKNYVFPNYAGFLIDNNYNYYSIYKDDNIIIKNLRSPKLEIRRYKFPNPELGIKAMFTSSEQVVAKFRASIMGIDYSGSKVNYTYYRDPLDLTRIFGTAIDANGLVWYSTVDKIYKLGNGVSIEQPQFGKIAFKTFEFCGKYMVGYTFDNSFLICSNLDGPVKVDTLPSQGCVWNKLFKMDSNSLLISTNNYYRLLTINPDSAIKYKLSLIENPFLPICESICADSSNCYFFKDGSITSIAKKSLLVQFDPPRLFFTHLRAGKKNYRISDGMELTFAQARNVSITFNTLSFGGKDVFYQYSISNNDNDGWRDIKGEEINLVQPDYGTYTIKIRARTISSSFGPPDVFRLTILRPYWATWWFISLCICAGALIIGVLVRLRLMYLVRKNKKEHENEVKFLKSEFKALNALMNPHFIFNTLNNVQSLFNTNDKLAANEYLRIFADLIRQNMQNVSKELIPLQREMALVMNYLMLEKLRFEDKLTYEFNVEDDIDLSEIMVPPLLIQPLVENSIKHGIFPLQKGTVVVNIFRRGDTMFIEVRDNGVGMSAVNKNKLEHESFGIQNIRRRIQQLSIIQGKEMNIDFTEINDENSNGRWTVVTVSIQLGS